MNNNSAGRTIRTCEICGERYVRWNRMIRWVTDDGVIVPRRMDRYRAAGLRRTDLHVFACERKARTI